jgi:hypothetical protein
MTSACCFRIENNSPNNSSTVASYNYRMDHEENTASQLLHCWLLRICRLATGVFAEPFPATDVSANFAVLANMSNIVVIIIIIIIIMVCKG